MNTERELPPSLAAILEEVGNTDSPMAKVLPSLPVTSPAVVLLEKTIRDFEELRLPPELAVALALNLAAHLASLLVVDGAPRGKVVNSLPEELRKRLQRTLPWPHLSKGRRT